MNKTQIRFAPAVASMRDYLEPHLPWTESVIGCTLPETITLQVELPITRLVTQELLKGAPLDGCSAVPSELRKQVQRWELPPHISPRISLLPSRPRGSSVVERQTAWHADWCECPIALWLEGEGSAFVAADIPYVSMSEGFQSNWVHWRIVNRVRVAPVLNQLGILIQESEKYVRTFGGGRLSFAPKYDWDAVVLDATTSQLVREDFETFFRREQWFRDHSLPFRRGYLFYGPPGNGKSTVIKVMASHPAITPFALDFGYEHLSNESLTSVFEIAAQNAAALLIFEDLDRAFTVGEPRDNREKVTLSHFLNCLDGIGTQDGLIVVATANDPPLLDAAILRRPGRLDRVVPFRPPDAQLRARYLCSLGRGALPSDGLEEIAATSDGLSFAQLRESYILAGQLAFESDSQVGIEHLRKGIDAVRSQMTAATSRFNVLKTGFGICLEPNP